jgi:hypothetical protein
MHITKIGQNLNKFDYNNILSMENPSSAKRKKRVVKSKKDKLTKEF